MNLNLKSRSAVLAATAFLGLALILSPGIALAGPFGTIAKNIDDIAGGVAKGGRAAADDIIEGGVRGADDAAEGLARGADDLGQGVRGIDDAVEGVARGADEALQGLGQGADDLGGVGRALPPDPGTAVKAPVYDKVAPLANDAPSQYDVVKPEELLNAHDLPDVPQGVAGYIQPGAPGFADDLGGAADALPGGYIQPGAPLGAPAKPAKPAKTKLPKLGGNTKVAKITALADDAAGVIDDGLQGGSAMKAVNRFEVPDGDFLVVAARGAAKSKSGKIKKIVAGTVVGVVAVGGGTTAALYYTLAPVKEGIDDVVDQAEDGINDVVDKTKDAIGGGLQDAADGVNGKTFTLMVNNTAEGFVDIYKLGADDEQTLVGGVYQAPGSTTVDVKENDVVVINLNDAEYTRIKIVEDKMQVDVQ